MRGKKWVHASGWSNGPISSPFTRPFRLSPMSAIQVMHVEFPSGDALPSGSGGVPLLTSVPSSSESPLRLKPPRACGLGRASPAPIVNTQCE